MDQIVPPRSSVPPVPPPPAMSSSQIAFTGDRGEFVHLVTKGGFLEIITVGFYRFWLATDVRRHLWAHTVVDGDGAEYTGRGKELLIGFLIAMAILVPIYIAYLLAGLAAEQAMAFASVPLFAFVYVFGQFAIYRARRYRLSRTVWRGVRFWMKGSGWAYALRASLWGLLVIVTLGLALPWRAAALERYKMKHSYYGDLQGRFEGQAWDFFKQAWWLWLLSPTAILMVPAPFLYAAFKAIQWRWWLSGVRFGDAGLRSRLENGELIGLYWKVIGWSTALSLAIGTIVGLVTYVMYHASGAELKLLWVGGGFTAANITFTVVTVLSYLAFVVGLNITIRVYLTRDLWQRVASSVTVYGVEALNNVAVKGDLANAIGEGFADGLDIGGF